MTWQAPATQMARESDEMPDAVARLSTAQARARSKEVAAQLRGLAPKALVTVGRGSSDHAATYLSYVVQSVLRLPVASIGPSIYSVYRRDLKINGLAALAISQSGGSGDISALCGSFVRAGGYVVALTNAPNSKLAHTVSDVIDVRAGPERAVAATKSFLNSVVAGLWLIADWAEDAKFVQALDRLPDQMGAVDDRAVVDQLVDGLAGAAHAMVIARGAAVGLAHEGALKLQETCALHAFGYSGAEVLHGPSAVVQDGYPVIALSGTDATGLSQAREQLCRQGANLIEISPSGTTGHPLVDPLLMLRPLYRAAENLSRQRGLNPDKPLHLRKVTKTI
ncbi:MAG: SIS domain-containing protein [Pseudomonadota bacterium]